MGIRTNYPNDTLLAIAVAWKYQKQLMRKVLKIQWSNGRDKTNIKTISVIAKDLTSFCLFMQNVACLKQVCIDIKQYL